MRLTYKNELVEKGLIELMLLTFLAIFLVQVNSLWTLSKMKLNQEKVSAEILKEDIVKKTSLYNLLKNDPTLSSIPNLSAGFKTTLKSPHLNYAFSLSDKGPSLNWLFFDSLKMGELNCKGSPLTSDSLCNLSSYHLTSSKIVPYIQTQIKELVINANIIHPALISFGNLTIENLVLNTIPMPKFNYLLISSYNNMRIDKISGALPNNTKLLFYSILGEIKINDTGMNKPCDSTGKGNLVFIGPAVNIAGKNRDDLRFSNKTCLKAFPNAIFTSIKIASIH